MSPQREQLFTGYQDIVSSTGMQNSSSRIDNLPSTCMTVRSLPGELFVVSASQQPRGSIFAGAGTTPEPTGEAHRQAAVLFHSTVRL